MAYCNLLSKAYAQDSIDYDFRKEDSRFVLEGFSGFEDWGCWTDGGQAEIKFPHPNSLFEDKNLRSNDWILELNAHAYLPFEISCVTAEALINSQVVKTLEFNSQRNYGSYVFSLSDFGQASELQILLKIKGNSSPASHTLSSDGRLLGLGFTSLKLYQGKLVAVDPLKARDFCAESKDFRLTEPPSDFLFSPIQYNLNSILYGEQEGSFEWLGAKERTLKGGELFAKKDVIILANDSCVFITDDKFNTVLLSSNPSLGQSLLSKPYHRMHHLKGKTCIFRIEGIFARHYYDFMLHFLPSIYFLSKKFPNDFKFLYQEVLQPYEKEAFKSIAFDAEKQLVPFSRVAQQGTLALSLEELILPCFGNVYWRGKQQQREFYPEIIQFLKETFVPTPPTSTNKRTRIYISRDDMLSKRGVTNARSVVNEEGILTLLAQQDFKKVVLSGKSIREQAEIFNEAEVVIGAHGAGFTNLVFCEKGTKVLEFIPPVWDAMAYFHLSAIAGLNHACIVGTPWEKDLNASFQVDEDALIEYLKTNGLYA